MRPAAGGLQLSELSREHLHAATRARGSTHARSCLGSRRIDSGSIVSAHDRPASIQAVSPIEHLAACATARRPMVRDPSARRAVRRVLCAVNGTNDRARVVEESGRRSGASLACASCPGEAGGRRHRTAGWRCSSGSQSYRAHEAPLYARRCVRSSGSIPVARGPAGPNTCRRSDFVSRIRAPRTRSGGRASARHASRPRLLGRHGAPDVCRSLGACHLLARPGSPIDADAATDHG